MKNDKYYIGVVEEGVVLDDDTSYHILRTMIEKYNEYLIELEGYDNVWGIIDSVELVKEEENENY